MNSDFDMQEENKVKRFQDSFISTHDAFSFQHQMKISAEWLAKEITLMSKKVEIDQEETPSFKNALITLAQWTTGNYLLKWHLPLTHSLIIKEIESNPELESFIFGKLPQLALAMEIFKAPESKADMYLFDIIRRLHIFPKPYNDLRVSFSVPLLETALPSYEYTQSFFFENHWLSILFFVLISYQFLGYDQENI